MQSLFFLSVYFFLHLHYLHRKEEIQYHFVGRRLRFHHVSFLRRVFFFFHTHIHLYTQSQYQPDLIVKVAYFERPALFSYLTVQGAMTSDTTFALVLWQEQRSSEPETQISAANACVPLPNGTLWDTAHAPQWTVETSVWSVQFKPDFGVFCMWRITSLVAFCQNHSSWNSDGIQVYVFIVWDNCLTNESQSLPQGFNCDSSHTVYNSGWIVLNYESLNLPSHPPVWAAP